MSNSTTIFLAFLAGAAAACSAAPGESTEAELASSQPALFRGDCHPYDGFTGALGAATVDCLGRVGAFDYRVETSTGVPVLVRKFDTCPNLNTNESELNLLQIDRLLSIQLPERQYLEQRAKYPKELANFPDAATCVAGAFASAQQRLLEKGNTVCPTFTRMFSIGGRTEANLNRVKSLLPKPSFIGNPPKLGFPPGSFGPKVRLPEEYPVYAVSFEQPPLTNQPCGSAEACAETCSSVFAGFYVARVGRVIVGDPDWWTDPHDYGFGASSPYWKCSDYGYPPCYYHPMAAVGALYGDIHRAPPLGVTLVPPEYPEECTYWTPDGDLFGRMVIDNPSAPPRNMLSRCQPW